MNDDHNDERKRRIDIPERTARAISARIDDTEFESVDEYVAFALDQLLTELDRQQVTGARSPDPDGSGDGRTDGTADAGDSSDAVEARLESLGYL